MEEEEEKKDEEEEEQEEPTVEAVEGLETGAEEEQKEEAVKWKGVQGSQEEHKEVAAPRNPTGYVWKPPSKQNTCRLSRDKHYFEKAAKSVLMHMDHASSCLFTTASPTNCCALQE